MTIVMCMWCTIDLKKLEEKRKIRKTKDRNRFDTNNFTLLLHFSIILTIYNNNNNKKQQYIEHRELISSKSHSKNIHQSSHYTYRDNHVPN